MTVDVRDEYAVTVGQDMTVKVWSLNPKRILREIVFSEGVQTAAFINSDLDLVIGHQNLISTI